MSYRVEAVFELVDNVSKTLEGIESKFKNIGATMQKVGGIMSAAVTAPLVMLGKASLETAIEAERLGKTLEGMAGSADNAAQYIEAIQKASGGTISEVDALSIANTALSFGVVKTTEDMEDLVTTSIGLGRAQGLDAVTAVGDFTTALSRNSPMILDNLGLTLKLSDAYEQYALMIDKPVEALTEMEKAEAFRAVALERGVGLVEAMGGVQDDAAASLERLNAMFADAKMLLGEQLIPIMTRFLDKLKPVFDWIRNLDEAKAAWIVKIGLVIAAIGPLLVILGTVVSAIGTIAGVLTGIGLPIILIIGAIVALGVAFATNFGGIRDVVLGFWKKVQPVVEKVVGFFRWVFAIVMGKVADFVQKTWQRMVDWYVANIPLIQETIATVMNRVDLIVTTVVRWIATVWALYGYRLLNLVTAIWNGIKRAVTTAVDTIMGVVRVAMLLITGDWEGAWAEIEKIAIRIWEAILKTIEDVTNAILGLFGTTWDTLLEDIDAWGRNAWDSITKWWGDIKTWFVELWEEIKKGVVDIGAAMMLALEGDFAGAWERIKAVFVNIWTKIVEGLATSMTTILDIFGIDTDAITKKLGEFKDTMLGLFTDEEVEEAIVVPWRNAITNLELQWTEMERIIPEKVGSIIAEASAKMKAGMGDATEGMLTPWPSLTSDLEGAMGDAAEGMLTPWGTVNPYLAGTLSETEAVVVTPLENILASIDQWGLDVDESMRTGLTDMFAAMGIDLEEFNATWDKINADIPIIAAAAWTSAKESVVEAVTEIYDSVVEYLAPLGVWFEEDLWGPIKESFTTAYDSLIKAADEQGPILVESITSWLVDAGAWFEEQWATFVAWGGDIIDGIKAGVVAKAGALLTSITTSVENAIAGAKEKLGIHSPSTVFMTFGEEMISGLIAGLADTATVDERIADLTDKIFAFEEMLQERVDRAVDWVTGIPKRIMDGIRSLFEQLKTFGQRIVMSLEAGIRSKLASLVNTLVGGVRNAVSKMAEALGMASPSRLMMDFGQNLMVGMALGISRSAALVGDEIADVAGRTVWTAGAYSLLPAGAEAPNVTNYNLTYNAYPYGLPNQANADEAMREIESQSYGRR